MKKKIPKDERFSPFPKVEESTFQGFPKAKDAPDYSRQYRRAAKISIEHRDIAPMPGIHNRWRRHAAAKSLLKFCQTYLIDTFFLPFSDDHLKLIATLQLTVIQGGQYAFLLPRGSGKTSLVLAACIWAVLTGRRKFIVLVSSDTGRAHQLLKNILTNLEVSELLFQDFPEVIYPLRRLEKIYHRAHGQILEGVSTNMLLSPMMFRLPTVKNSPSGGSIITAVGLLSGLRGMVITTPSGKSIRPDLVLVDDPQTDSSAASANQCARREKVISSAILALGGPGVKIAAFAAVTQIAPLDLAERLLDRKRCPDWQGTRMPMLSSLPTNMKLWDKYNDIRITGLQNDRGIVEATEFYKDNRKEMDFGAVVSWKHRFNPDEVSAIQHSMNLRYRDPNSFASEYQGKPETESRSRDLTFEAVVEKLDGTQRGSIPTWAQLLTAAVDLHDNLAYWAVCCWDQGFRGHVVDWGTYPEQPSAYFSLNNARPSLSDAHPGVGREGLIRLSLENSVKRLVDKDWKRVDGASLRMFPVVCDANWGASTGIVYEFAALPICKGLVFPSHGRYIGASRQPINAYRPEAHEMSGEQWRLRPPKSAGGSRYLIFDSNHWKSFLAERLMTALGDKGSLSIAGDRNEVVMIAEHVLSEIRIPVEAQGRKIEEWRLKTNKPDNHLLDVLTMCCVGASLVGAKITKVVVKEKEADLSTARKELPAVSYIEV